MKCIFALTQRKPCRTGNQSIDDIAVHTVTSKGNSFIAGFGCNRDDIAFQNVAFDLQIFSGIGIIVGVYAAISGTVSLDEASI